VFCFSFNPIHVEDDKTPQGEEEHKNGNDNEPVQHFCVKDPRGLVGNKKLDH
jgi:hypothetical protein